MTRTFSDHWSSGLAAATMALAVTLLPVGHALAKDGSSCDRKCLEGFAERYMGALAAEDPGRLPWADIVHFTENDIAMRIGDGAWATVNAVQDDALVAADPDTGNVAWLGWVEEHGAPAYFGLRLQVKDQTITQAETVVARKLNSPDFGDPKAYDPESVFEKALPRGDQQSRDHLIGIVDGYYSTLQQNDGTLFTHFADDCARMENGIDKTGPGAIAKGCEAQMKLGLFAKVTHVSDRRFPLVDPERGIVVAFAHRDYQAHSRTFTTTDGKQREVKGLFYPWTYSVIQVFKIRDGGIADIQTISTMLPYGMPSPWRDVEMQP